MRATRTGILASDKPIPSMRAALVADLQAEGYTKFEADQIASKLLVAREARRLAMHELTQHSAQVPDSPLVGLAEEVVDLVDFVVRGCWSLIRPPRECKS